MKTTTDCAIHVNNEQCKNSCIFCKSPDFRQVSQVDHDSLVKDMYRQAMNLKKKGLLNVEISGHDPIEYEFISEYISWLKKICFKNVTLATHGRNLSDDEISRKILSSGVDCIRIPLYGSTAKIHDKITNSIGSFDETISGLRKICGSGIELCIVTMIFDYNIDDMKNIADIALSLNADFHVLNVGISNGYVLNHVVDFIALKKILPSFYLHCKKNLKDKFHFFDFAHCLFSSRYEEVIFTGVPEMSDTYEVPSSFKTEKTNVPDYRIMKHAHFCTACKYRTCCSGFRKKQLDIKIPDRIIVPDDFFV